MHAAGIGEVRMGRIHCWATTLGTAKISGDYKCVLEEAPGGTRGRKHTLGDPVFRSLPVFLYRSVL